MGLAVILGRGERTDVVNVPFVYVNDSHAKQRYQANDDGGDYDAHDDRHVPTVNGG